MIKQYKCEISDCGRSVGIRSTIKTGELKGKKVCPSCINKIEPKQRLIQKPITKQTKKTSERRKEERKGLSEFFARAIVELKRSPYCQNCGIKINTDLHAINNIAHLLKKQTYKSVMINRFNYVFLCDVKEGGFCHQTFDNKVSERPLMAVFEVALVKYKMFKDDIVEQGNEREIYENIYLDKTKI